jgi:hypothetical protein
MVPLLIVNRLPSGATEFEHRLLYSAIADADCTFEKQKVFNTGGFL